MRAPKYKLVRIVWSTDWPVETAQDVWVQEQLQRQGYYQKGSGSNPPPQSGNYFYPNGGDQWTRPGFGWGQRGFFRGNQFRGNPQGYRNPEVRQYQGNSSEYQDAPYQQVYQNSQQQKPQQPTISVLQGNPVPPQASALGNSNGKGVCLGTIEVSSIVEAPGKLERMVPESQLMALINLAVLE